MASFHPIDPDKNPNKKQKVNNVDTSTSPHTVTQEISPLSLHFYNQFLVSFY